uniref:Uncharacterized protein n=1 Tax=Rhizophora mucronata TaxID=61149 RepID=A0A2P2J136_RHIMU
MLLHGKCQEFAETFDITKFYSKCISNSCSLPHFVCEVQGILTGERQFYVGHNDLNI